MEMGPCQQRIWNIKILNWNGFAPQLRLKAIQKRQLPYLWMVCKHSHSQNMFGSSMLTPLSLNAQIWKTKHTLSHSSQAKVHCCFRVLFKVGSPTLNRFCQSNICKEPLCRDEERAMISCRFSLVSSFFSGHEARQAWQASAAEPWSCASVLGLCYLAFHSWNDDQWKNDNITMDKNTINGIVSELYIYV